MRTLVLALAAVALAACQQSLASPSTKGDGFAPAECSEDRECVAAAATCCDCPTFAVRAADPAQRACGSVMCPMNQCPNNVQAACRSGACTLVCAQLACPTTCATGYAMDADGCLACTCAEPAPDGCTSDGDCVRVRADCCGCDHGGEDTAVAAVDAAAPACPSMNPCDPSAAPHCLAGHCELSDPSATLPPGACGRPDLPACPAGSVCVINGNGSADMQGVGVCTPQ
jgi:hypothetical protein